MKRNCLRYTILILFSILSSVSVLNLDMTGAGAQPPVPGQIYSGTVTIVSSPSGSGEAVTAKVNGAQVGSATTDAASKYFMMIPGNAGVTVASGAIITFYVNGVPATPTATYGSGSLNVNITAASAGSTPTALSATSLTLAGATVGSSYSASVSASGGTAPYTWTLTSGSLPAGLSLSSSGIISGTPTSVSASNFTLQVTDSTSQSASAVYSIAVSGVTSTTCTITTSGLPGGTVGSAYSATLAASGVTSPYTWTLVSGSLPAGLSISSSGVISGTPTTAASSTFTIRVADSASHNNTAALSINVSAAPTTTTTTTTATTPTTTTETTAANTPATTAQTATVSTIVLGSAGSFAVSNGAVSTAASLGSADGRISLNLAANTAVNLKGNSQLTVTQLSSPPAPPASTKILSAYTFGPDSSTFSPALTVTIKYSPSDIPAGVSESDLYIAALEGSDWNALQSTVNTQAKTVTAQLTHFSTYALMGWVASPQASTAAGFTVSDLLLTPEIASVGEPVTLSLRVANSGATEDSKPVVVKVNDKNEAQQIITLAPGKSKFVSFDLNMDAPGTYRVSVEGLNASLEVKGTASAGKSQQPFDFMQVIVPIVFGAGLLLIAVLIVLIVRRRS